MLKQLFYLQSGSGENRKPQLALRIGEKHAGFVIMDLAASSVRELAWYTTETRFENYLPQLFEKHPVLSVPFFKTIVSFDTADSALVPPSLSGEPAREMLRILTGVPASATIISDSLPGQPMNNVYAVPGDLHFWIRSKLNPATYLHQYTVTSRVIRPNGGEDLLYMDVRNDEFILMAYSGQNLVLAQTFPYQNPEDVLYYLLKTCQQFGFDQNSIMVRISGLVDEQSALYNELRFYFRNLVFRQAEWNLPEGEFPAHFFTALNDLNLCVS